MKQIKQVLSVILCVLMLMSALACLSYAAEIDPEDVCRTEYRYKDKEYTTSTNASLTGWTLRTDVSPNPKVTYGAWSGYQRTVITPNSNLEVRTATFYRYYAFVCPWCGTRDDLQGPCSSGCGYTLGEWNWEETWSPISYANCNSQAVSGSKRYTYSLGDGKKWYFGTGNLYDTAPGTIASDGPYAVVIEKRYSSRTKTTTYYYEKWGAWSNWSTVVPQEANDRIIESRTLLHDWDNGAVFTPATCSDTGVLKYTCKRDGCGATKTEPIAVNPNNHVNTENVAATASTCTVKGYSAGVYCNDCKSWISGHEEQALDSTNHVNTENVAAVASTCTVKGYSAGVYCNDCQSWVSGHEEQPLAAHQITVINAKEATDKAEGYTGDEYCTVCEQTIKKGSVIPVLTPNPDDDPNGQNGSGGQSSKRCKWCGKEHHGFLGMFVEIFHLILAFLFGARY